MTHARTLSLFWKATAFGGLAVLLSLLYIGLWRDPSLIPSAQIGRTAKAFTLERLDTEGHVSLSDHRGKWQVVNFWASWCGACRQEHDVLVAAGKRFASSDNIAVVGVNFRDGKKAALRFLEREGAFPYPSGRDPNGRTGIDFGVYGLPETYFIDPEGRIHSRHVGPLTNAVLLRSLDQALKESPQ